VHFKKKGRSRNTIKSKRKPSKEKEKLKNNKELKVFKRKKPKTENNKREEEFYKIINVTRKLTNINSRKSCSRKNKI
jgi:leucyl aminopeptidase